MVNPSVIMKRVEEIEKHLGRIRPFASLSYEAFLGDCVAQDVVELGGKDVRALLTRIVSRFL
jgi:hypothetical protein